MLYFLDFFPKQEIHGETNMAKYFEKFLKNTLGCILSVKNIWVLIFWKNYREMHLFQKNVNSNLKIRKMSGNFEIRQRITSF